MSLLSDVLEYAAVTGVAIATLGESYAHLLPSRLLPKSLASGRSRARVGRASTILLVAMAILAIPIAILKNREGEQLDHKVALIDAAFQRDISPDQVQLLRRFAERATDLDIRVLPAGIIDPPTESNQEIARYAVQLAYAFGKDRRPTFMIANVPVKKSDTGLLVAIDKSNNKAQALLNALRIAEFDVTDISERTKVEKNVVEIWVARMNEQSMSHRSPR